MAFPRFNFLKSLTDAVAFPKPWNRNTFQKLHDETQDYINNTLLPLIDLPNSAGYSGYYKLPNGFIIQWGTKAVTAANQWQAANLPIPFPNACLIAVGNSVSVNSYGGAGKDGASKTSINVWANNSGASIDFIAIGY